MSTPDTPTMRMHLWLESEQGVLCGQGRIQLLEHIAFTGSLSAAAKSLGMGYRAAWGKIKATEEVLGVALLQKLESKKSGTQLTEDGLALVAAYRAWQKEVEQFARDSAATYFGYTPKLFWSVKDVPSPPSSFQKFPPFSHTE